MTFTSLLLCHLLYLYHTTWHLQSPSGPYLFPVTFVIGPFSVPREFRDSARAEKSAEFSKPRGIWKTPRNPAERGENRPFQISGQHVRAPHARIGTSGFSKF